MKITLDIDTRSVANMTEADIRQALIDMVNAHTANLSSDQVTAPPRQLLAIERRQCIAYAIANAVARLKA